MLIYLAAFDTDDDRRIFEEIYVKYKDAAFRNALKVNNNRAMAEDALHNGFMQIINDWEKFLQIPCDKRQSLIVIIVKNKMIDLLRKEKKLVSIDEETDYPDGIDLSEIVERKEESEFVKKSVAKLPEIYKTALELKYFHDMSNSEIAETLGITAHTASVRISRATARLAEIMRKGE